METTTTLPAIAVDEIKAIISEAPAILEQNTTSVAKAEEVGRKLLDLAKTDGMSDLLDEQMATYQGKVKVTVKTMNERRKGFTQVVDKIKKHFTTLESALDPVVDEIQGLRNAYAAKKIAEQKERERQALLQKQKEMERVELRKQAEVQLSAQFQKCLADHSRGMLDQFEAYTLETIATAEIGIKSISEVFGRDVYDSLTVSVIPIYATEQEALAIIAEVKSDAAFATFSQAFRDTVAKEKRNLIDKIPSKKQELVEIANADEQERKRLEAEAAQRKADDEARIKAEEEENKRKAAEEATVKASGEAANVMVTAQAEMSFTEAPKVKESYEIVVKNPAAYLVIAQFWFEKEGKTLSQDKIERKTFAQMRAFCEAWALKHEEKITSPFIEYKEVIKAK